MADNKEANITISLVQQRPSSTGVELITRRVSENGVLSLEGVDFENAAVFSDYILIVSTDKATSYTMSYESNWTSGVDFFDFTRTQSIDSTLGGNNSLDKATQLAAGNYGGLMTYAGDADFYQLISVYADILTVTIYGSGLTVKEYDADGNFVKDAVYNKSTGVYSIEVKNGHYLYIEGNADPALNQVNSYTLKISDVESTFVESDGEGYIERPIISIVGNHDGSWIQMGTVKATVSEGATAYYSTDTVTWHELLDNTFETLDNKLYYFCAKDAAGNVSSNYCLANFEYIDYTAPELTDISTEYYDEGLLYVPSGEDDMELSLFEYRLNNGYWQQCPSDGVLLSDNATIEFRAVDNAGNYSNSISRQANAGTAEGDIVGETNADGDIVMDFAPSSVVNGKVYSGKNENITGDVAISAVGGDFNDHVHAGIIANNGGMYQVNGSLFLEITDTEFDNDKKSRIYVAGDVSNGSFARLNGDISFTLNNVRTSTMTYVGANVEKDSEFTLKGSIAVEINDGNYKNIYVAGSVADGAVSKIFGDVSLTINGGTFSTVGMGSQCKTDGSSIIFGDSQLTITGGEFSGQVYGGVFSQGGIAQLGGKSVLNISGGTFKKNIYAGSFANDTKTNCSIKTLIGGDTELTLDASVNQISFADGIFLYAGSCNYGVVAGNTNVFISGKGENLLFGGGNVISGDSLMYQLYGITYIGGNKNITFDNFSGRLDAEIFSFTHFNAVNGSQIEFGNQNHLGNIQVWNISLTDGETAVKCTSGNNSFKQDTLDLVFDESLAEAVIFDAGESGLLDYWDQLEAIKFNGVAGSWSASELAWVDAENKWKVFADADRNDLIISKIV